MSALLLSKNLFLMHTFCVDRSLGSYKDFPRNVVNETGDKNNQAWEIRSHKSVTIFEKKK